MTDLPAKPAAVRKTGLSPKEQKLQALRDKLAAQTSSGSKVQHDTSAGSVRARSSFAGKKTAFQRKAT